MRESNLRLGLIGLALFSGVATAFAVRGFFDRPGEAALRLIPSDALIVGSLDLVPAPGQVLEFKSLESAFQKSGQKDPFATFLASTANDPALVAAVGPYVKRSLAIGGFGQKNMAEAIVIALSDPEAAAIGLRKNCKAVIDKSGVYYQSTEGRAVRISDGYLEIVTKPDLFLKLNDVRDGKAKSIASDETFAKTWKQADPAANLKVSASFIPGTLITGTVKNGGMEFAIKIANGGFGIPEPFQSALTKAPSLQTSVNKRLPLGAYGVVGISSLSSFLSLVGNQVKSIPGSMSGLFKGDAMVALYPSDIAPRSGIDVLIMVDGANGGNPSGSIVSLRKQVEKQFTDGEPIFRKPVKVGQANVYELSKSLKGILDQGLKSVPSDLDPKLLKGKTLVYATVGQTVYLSTSRKLIETALSTYAGQSSSLNSDPAFPSLSESLASSSRLVLTVNPGRVMEGATHSLSSKSEMLGNAKELMEWILPTDKSASVNLGSDTKNLLHGRIFVPLNFSYLGKKIAQN